MHRIKQYLEKQGVTESRIKAEPDSDLGIIIVIPAYKEEDISYTLSSLFACVLPNTKVEVLVLVNGSALDSQETIITNEKCINDCIEFQKKHEHHKIKLHIMEELEMSSKKSGVGRARKILMDEASFRFLSIGNESGIIVNLDADCSVANNYLVEIEKYFEKEYKISAASIYFEHHIEHEAILNYELHLRYFIGMQHELNLPFAFQTIGSAMAVKVLAYASIGGMNTRKAGEDFYFLHKFIKNQVCGNLYTTAVIPSGRVSDRVPFGTGRAVGEMIDKKGFTTYNPASFLLLRAVVNGLEELYMGEDLILDKRLSAFLESISFDEKVEEIRRNTKDLKSFSKRFYQFFDAFKLMKFLHFVREIDLPDLSLEMALPNYFDLIGVPFDGVSLSSLEKLRSYDRKLM